MARAEARRFHEAGIDTEQLEAAARQLLGNGQFEDCEEDTPLVLEEFYPESSSDDTSSTPIRSTRLTQQLGKPAEQAA